MDIKLFLMIFGGIGALAVFFRLIFGFIPKGNEMGKTTKWGHPEKGKAVTDDDSPFFSSSFHFDDFANQ